jgi:hypothetical protein
MSCGKLFPDITAAGDRDAWERILVQQVLTFAVHQPSGGAGQGSGQ